MQATEGMVFNDEKLRRLEPIVDGWFSAIRRYQRTIPGEPPYWFNERANLSIFAAGAWLKGAIAIEEYACEKERGKNKRNGRADLYIGTDSWDASFEAKLAWTRASFSDAELVEAIKTKIDLALGDVKKVYDTYAKIGMCFYVPRFSKRKFPDFLENADGLIATDLGRYLGYKPMHLWAWSFPRGLQFSESSRDGSYYPGVILGFKAHRMWKTDF